MTDHSTVAAPALTPTSTAPSHLALSVVIPVFNECESVTPLYHRLVPVLAGIEGRCEIIFVDDGSTDGTRAKLAALHRKDPRVKVLEFRRNFGQTAALTAGFAHAAGEVVVTMDGDLQNDPADIPVLLTELDRGYDVVSGWRSKRADPTFSKRIPSKISNRLARMLTGVQLNDFGCSLKAYRREVLDDLVLYGEMHRYIPAILSWNGYRVGEVKVEHHKRRHGKTKYGWRRLLHGFWDLMNLKFWSAYSTRPLHFFGVAGAIIFILGLVIAIHLTIQRVLFSESLSDRPLLMFAILMIIFGMQIFMFGFLAEVNARMYYSDRLERTYSIRRRLGSFQHVPEHRKR